MRRRHRSVLALLIVALQLPAFACTGQLSRTEGRGPDVDSGGPVVDIDLGAARDSGGTPIDLGSATPVDLGTTPTADLGSPPVDMGRPPVDMGRPPVDMGTPPPVDMGRPPVDMGTPPPVDMGTIAACAGGPLALPIAGCMPTPVPDTGDPHADCVARINQFRYQCQCLPPLARWTDGEACADMNASYDQMAMRAHAGFSARICGSGSAQNECPGWLGWGSVSSTISGCLQQMWDEGPGDFYGPPAHGHYINMSSSSYSRVACGFYTSGGATTAVQNFQ